MMGFRARLAIAAFAALFVHCTAAATALTVTDYNFTSSIDGTGSSSPPFSSVSGLGFNQADQSLYAVDPGNSAVYKFNASASPPVPANFSALGSTTFPWSSGNSTFNPEQSAIAVDNSGTPSQGQLYLIAAYPGSLQAFAASGTELGGNFPFNVGNTTVGQFAGCGGAVDRDGNFWLVNNNPPNPLTDYTSTGSPLSDGFQLAADQTDPCHLAIDTSQSSTPTSGYLYLGSRGPHPQGFDGTNAYTASGVFKNVVTYQTTTAVAVDSSTGNIYTANGNIITEFAPSSNDIPGPELTTFGGPDPAHGLPNGICGPITGLAVDEATHAVYVADCGGTRIDEFHPSSTPHIVPTTVTDPVTQGFPTATLNGHVDPADGGDITDCHFDYGPTPHYGQSVPCASSAIANSDGNTAVNAPLGPLVEGATYHYRLVAANASGVGKSYDQSFTAHAVLGVKTGDASNVNAVSATLNGVFTGNGLDTHYYFEWGTDTRYGNTAPLPPGGDAGPTMGVTPVSVDIGQLQPVTTYHYRVVAVNSTGTTIGQDNTFTTTASAPFVSESVTDVHADTARLQASVDPRGADTTYQFEYGPSDCASNPCTALPAPPSDIGSTPGIQSLSLTLRGLSQGTTYHYRVVAENALGTVSSTDHTFTTFPSAVAKEDVCPNTQERQQTGAALLLDCRAYELVSSPDTGGHDIESNLVPGQTPYQGFPQATNPPRALYAVHSGAIPGIEGDPTNFGLDPYLATRGPGGWSTRYVGIPANDPYTSGSFASTLVEADPKLDTFAFGGPDICSPCLSDGSSGIPLYMPDGSLIQGMAGSISQPAAVPAGLIQKHFSADGSHFIFGSTSQFEPDGNSNGDISIYDRDLNAGVTHVVSKTPGGQTMTGPGIAELDVSSDGSRILIGQKVGADAKGNDLFHLYMNIGDSDHTIDLTPGASSGVLYDGMSADGAKVFFTATDALTTTSNQDSDSSADIYEMDLGDPQNPVLSRVSSGSNGTGNTDSCNPPSAWNTPSGASDCSALAIGGGGGVASGDGSIYFFSPELLDGSSNGTEGQPNLYVVHPGSGPHFIATLEVTNPAILHALSSASVRNTADFQVTPSGNDAVFITTKSLKQDYDNAEHVEIYRYDVLSDRLDCVSCASTGLTPTSQAGLASRGLSVTNDGRVFFTSAEPLAPSDNNGVKDAYEWSNGTVGLVSTGLSPFDSGLMSVSADGTDAYFFTREPLTPQTPDGATVKLYDARVNGGFAFDPPKPLCAASDECHGPGTQAPGDASIRSVAGTGHHQVVPTPIRRIKHHPRKRHRKVRHHHRGGAK